MNSPFEAGALRISEPTDKGPSTAELIFQSLDQGVAALAGDKTWDIASKKSAETLVPTAKMENNSKGELAAFVFNSIDKGETQPETGDKKQQAAEIPSIDEWLDGKLKTQTKLSA